MWSTLHVINTILGHYAHFWIFWREFFVARKKRLAARGSGSQARKIASPVWPGLYLYHLINNFAVKRNWRSITRIDNKIKYQRSLVKAKRSFTTRTKEHMRNVKHCTEGSNVAKHAWTFNHVIDFNNSKIIDKANYRSRKTLKSWHRAKTVGADNNSCLLPRQYHILLKKHWFS